VKLFCITSDSGTIDWRATKGEAIKEARRWMTKQDGEAEDMCAIIVEEHEIGKLTKAVAISLVTGRGFYISKCRVWPEEKT